MTSTEDMMVCSRCHEGFEEREKLVNAGNLFVCCRSIDNKFDVVFFG